MPRALADAIRLVGCQTLENNTLQGRMMACLGSGIHARTHQEPSAKQHALMQRSATARSAPVDMVESCSVV